MSELQSASGMRLTYLRGPVAARLLFSALFAIATAIVSFPDFERARCIIGWPGQFYEQFR